MTIATQRTRPWGQTTFSFVQDRLQKFTASARTYRQRRAVYRATLSELGSLSDRELADVGIARTQVRRVARDAANMVQS